MSATEQQAERAIAILKRAIDAAENSNQAGEDAVVRFAAAPELYEAGAELVEARTVLEVASTANSKVFDAALERHERALAALTAALSRARGEA